MRKVPEKDKDVLRTQNRLQVNAFYRNLVLELNRYLPNGSDTSFSYENLGILIYDNEGHAHRNCKAVCEITLEKSGREFRHALLTLEVVNESGTKIVDAQQTYNNGSGFLSVRSTQIIDKPFRSVGIGSAMSEAGEGC